MGWTLIQYGWCPFKKRERHEEAVAQRKGRVRTQDKVATCKPRKGVSGETKPANTLTLDFSFQNCEAIHFLLCKSLVCDMGLKQTSTECFLPFLENISGAQKMRLLAALSHVLPRTPVTCGDQVLKTLARKLGLRGKPPQIGAGRMGVLQRRSSGEKNGPNRQLIVWKIVLRDY